jgi:solute carrier family 5 (sodium-coupled monocarboxylate transporter), member 8/12
MPGEFSVWNWVVVAIYLAGVYAIGLSASRHQKTSEDFFLAGRSMGAIPVGLSICMTLFSAVSYTALANQSYYHGLLLVMSMVMVWIDAPVVCLIVIPFFYKLKLYSIYEYLEKRFSPSVRIVGGAIFFFWRMLWLGIVIYAPCKVLQVVLELATGHAIPVELLVVVVGVATTLYTVLGGMRAVIWTDVAQFCVMFGSVIAIIAVVWLSMDQGPAEVWAYAEQGGRDKFVHAEFDLQDPWCIWGIVPFYFLARLAFYSADQITMQRVLTARDLKSAQKAFVLNCVALSIFIPLLCYVGLSLYAFYQKHPDRVPAQYQVSANEETESSKSESSPPDAWPKKHPQTGKKLEDKILPTFVALELPVGIAGLVVSALFAACMSTMDSGLNSVATSLIVDFHRRWGIGKSWLAKRLSKPVSELDEADELTLARPLVVLIGVLAIGFGCAIGQFGTIFEIARIAIDTPGIPLACIFLLGMLTIRTNTVGALCGLFAGLATMVWLAVGPKLADMGITALWPWKNENGEIWNLAPIYPGVIGAFVTVVLAYGISLLTGKHKSREELRGLSWQARDAAEK